MASGLQDPSLMKCQGTEITASEASSVARQAEFNLFQCRDPALFLIHGMNSFCIGKCIDIIHFLLRQRQCRRILYHISPASVKFRHWSGAERVRILVLYGKAVRVGLFVLFYFFIRRKNNGLVHTVQIFTLENSSCDIGDLFHRNPALQGFCYLYNGMFSHSVGDQVCSGIDQYTVFDFILPVVIMCHTSEACLNTAQNDGSMFIGLTDQVAVYNSSPVRTKSHLPSRGIGILLSVLLRHSVMIDHGIHISGCNQKSQPGFAEYLYTLFLSPVRLTDDPHFISAAFQQSADNGRTKGRMVHIGIPCHVDKVCLFPSPLFHFFFIYR